MEHFLTSFCVLESLVAPRHYCYLIVLLEEEQQSVTVNKSAGAYNRAE